VTWASNQALRDEVKDWTGGDGPPLVIETSGETAVLPKLSTWSRRPAGSW
jgi:hypothetical protein